MNYRDLLMKYELIMIIGMFIVVKMIYLWRYSMLVCICICINGDEYCWWKLLMNIVDENWWWKLLMIVLTCIVVYEYMRRRVICSCIHGQVLLVMIIGDGGSIDNKTPTSKTVPHGCKVMSRTLHAYESMWNDLYLILVNDVT